MTLSAPTNAGTYAQKFGWTVKTPSGFIAFSGGEREARAYLRAMMKRGL